MTEQLPSNTPTKEQKPLDWFRKRFFGERTAAITPHGLTLVDEYNRMHFSWEEAEELQKWLNANLYKGPWKGSF